MSSKVFREAISEHIVELSQSRLADVVASYKTVTRANTELKYATGIRNFFASRHEFEDFCRVIKAPIQKVTSQQKREWGDFQTPPSLAKQVCQYLCEFGVAPTVVVEPTYGLGNFILASLETFPKLDLVYGVELQEKYEWHLKIALLIKSLLGRRVAAEVELHRDNIFSHEFPEGVLNAQRVLVIGNPPWVTSAALGALESANLPAKENLKSLNGMDALTGKSNFDISEYILLRLLDLFSTRHATLAMLCKTATAKNIVEVLPQKGFPVSNIRTLEIDANREFGVAVDACLLVTELGSSRAERTCRVATLENPKEVTRIFGWVGDKFVSNVKDYRANAALDGKSVFVWRQGIKHDCSPVMELSATNGTLVNGENEIVDVELEYVYGLLKSSDLKGFQAAAPRKQVLVTQQKLGEDTDALRTRAPKLWKYLVKHEVFFEKRKSSIYRNKPRFSIFGVGDYSFKPYKVAVSGFYKELNFCLVCPANNRPVMLDDTGYFLGFDTYLDALFAVSVLNSASVKQFLSSIVFRDAKRPYTKEVLMRVNLARAASHLSLQDLQLVWKTANYQPQIVISESGWENFKRGLSDGGIVTANSFVMTTKKGQLQLIQ